MSVLNLAIVIDRLQRQSAAARAQLRKGETAPALDPAALALTFKPGDTVFDLATGLTGTVVAGVREAVSGSEYFTIDLATGDAVIRHARELAKKTLPAAPGGSSG